MLFRHHVVIFFLGGLVVNRQVSAGYYFRNSPQTSATSCMKFVHCDDGREVDDEGTATGLSCYEACRQLGGIAAIAPEPAAKDSQEAFVPTMAREAATAIMLVSLPIFPVW